MLIGIDASRAVDAQRTGTEAYAYQLIRAFLPLAAQHGHQVRLYYNQPPTTDLFTAPHQPIALPFPRLWTHIRLAAELHTHPPDLFFTPAHVIPISYFGASIATVHDLGYYHFPQAHTRKQWRYLRWSTRHNAQRSRLVLAVSEATKQDLIHFDGIDPAKIKLLYSGHDPDLQREESSERWAEVQARHQISSPYFLYLGTLQPRKNLVRLVRAFASIAEQLPHSLVLAGKMGWLSEEISAEIERYPTLRHRIHLTGFVADEEKASLISGATAVVYPSLYEGFGFPVLEGFGCGTPVLTSNSSSLPEVADDAALLVDPMQTQQIADGMRRLATDFSLREQLIARGTKRLQQFTWEKSAEQLLQVIENEIN